MGYNVIVFEDVMTFYFMFAKCFSKCSIMFKWRLSIGYACSIAWITIQSV